MHFIITCKSSIGAGLASFQDGRHGPKMPPGLQDGRQDLRRPGDAFGVTSEGELTP